LLGHLIAYRRDPLAFFSSCANGPGSVIECRLGGRGYVLNDPADIRHVLVGNQGQLRESQTARRTSREVASQAQPPDQLRHGSTGASAR